MCWSVRWVLLVSVVLPGLSALPASASAASSQQRQLLVRYQPVTVLDTNESFAPTTVGSFVADANLETQTAPNVWSVVDPQPSATSLPTTPTPACVSQALAPCYRLNQRDCSPAGGFASVACYQADWLTPRPRSVVYGRATTAGPITVLQYWYFYYDDFYSYNHPPDNFIWQAHEGDWDAVTVLLRRGGSHPRWVGYSQHCIGERRSWNDVPRWRGSSPPEMPGSPVARPAVASGRRWTVVRATRPPPGGVGLYRRRSDARLRRRGLRMTGNRPATCPSARSARCMGTRHIRWSGTAPTRSTPRLRDGDAAGEGGPFVESVGLGWYDRQADGSRVSGPRL
jgi:hypothetical protein